jgi:hypothetical protein
MRSTAMSWTKLDSGKHAGKTLPQLLFADPDYFFWGVEVGAFKGALTAEAAELRHRATHVKIHQSGAEQLVAEYVIHPGVKKFTDLNFVPKSRPAHEGGSQTFRMDHIDLSVPRRISHYDKKGGKMLISVVKQHYFGSASARMTRERCEQFFDEKKNFLP